MSTVHSRFAPSSLHRVLECPRSVALAEAAVAADPSRAASSTYAAEGTIAHLIAAEYLRGSAMPGALAPGQIVQLEGHAIAIDGAMHGHGLEYASYVRSLLPRDGELLVEKIVRLDAVVGAAAEMYGHLDAGVISVKAGHLDIVDYKYGSGIRVSPVDNAQLMAYALGALYALREPERHQVHTIGLHVYQPRISDGIVSYEMAAVDLLMWGAEILAPTIGAIVNGDELPPLKVGDWCRFCPALVECPAWAEKADREMRQAFGLPVATLASAPADELAATLRRVRELAPWIAGVEDEARRRLVDNGDDVPGFKAVVSQWRRAWVGTVEPKAIAAALGLASDDVMTEPVMRSPADLEKKIPKSERSRLEPFVERKPHGVSVVATDDPRPAIDRAIPDVKTAKPQKG